MQRGIQLEGPRPRCPRMRMFHAFNIAGSNEGTEAGAPPGRGYEFHGRPFVTHVKFCVSICFNKLVSASTPF
jgi:hypothetical protein